jgi:hypothetical protein
MPSLFACARLARSHTQSQVESFAAQILHRVAVQVPSSIKIHFPRQHLEAPRRRHQLDRRNERKIRDRAVPSREKNHVTAGSHLASDAL